MADRVPSYKARLDRGHEHLHLLMSSIRLWVDVHGPLPVEEKDPSTGVTAVRIELAEPLPESWGPLIGDVLHNLRSSLDHLASALTVAHAGRPLTKAEEKRSEFPIFDDSDEFHEKGRRSIHGIAPGARRVIEELQPYQRGSESGLDPLWLLYLLSNIDKHRRAALTYLYAQPEINIRSGEVVEFNVGEPGPVEPGAAPFVLGTYKRRQPDDDAQVGVGFRYDIAFGEELDWQPPWVLHLLWSIWAYIGETVFPRLTPYLSSPYSRE